MGMQNMTVVNPPVGCLRIAVIRQWALLCCLLLIGCGGSGKSGSPSNKIPVLATTGMIADAARIVGGDHVEVTALMGPGVDPHTYQPTPRDSSRLQNARIVFYNGLHLEGKMVETFEALARKQKVVAISRDIPKEKLLGWQGSGESHDPHIWFDVRLWKTTVETIAAVYSEVDPPHAPQYAENSRKYLAELDQLDEYCRKRTAELEPSQRVLVTSHDAFHYFGRAYGFEVVGIQGISTETEANSKDVTDTIDLIRKRKLRAIFPEDSVPPKIIKEVSKDTGVKLGDKLYSDALGAPDSTAATYTGMIRTNIDSIIGGLKAN